MSPRGSDRVRWAYRTHPAWMSQLANSADHLSSPALKSSSTLSSKICTSRLASARTSHPGTCLRIHFRACRERLGPWVPSCKKWSRATKVGGQLSQEAFSSIHVWATLSMIALSARATLFVATLVHIDQPQPQLPGFTSRTAQLQGV